MQPVGALDGQGRREEPVGWPGALWGFFGLGTILPSPDEAPCEESSNGKTKKNTHKKQKTAHFPTWRHLLSLGGRVSGSSAAECLKRLFSRGALGGTQSGVRGGILGAHRDSSRGAW